MPRPLRLLRQGADELQTNQHKGSNDHIIRDPGAFVLHIVLGFSCTLVFVCLAFFVWYFFFRKFTAQSSSATTDHQLSAEEVKQKLAHKLERIQHYKDIVLVVHPHGFAIGYQEVVASRNSADTGQPIKAWRQKSIDTSPSATVGETEYDISRRLYSLETIDHAIYSVAHVEEVGPDLEQEGDQLHGPRPVLNHCHRQPPSLN